MSPAKIEMSPHAQERIRKRKIPRNKILATILSGDQLNVDNSERRIRIKKFNGKKLIVVYIGRIGGYLVITAYWQGKET